jgi:hypothetical protein
MIEPATRELITIASELIEEAFRRTGVMRPMYHVVHADGRQEIIQAPPLDKDTAVALMRAYFSIADIRRYVMIDECWRLDLRATSKAEADAAFAFCQEHGVSMHPKKIEAVMFVAEDALGQLNAYRIIERPANGKPRLGPLKFDPEGGNYEGRMVGLLRPKGKVQ